AGLLVVVDVVVEERGRAGVGDAVVPALVEVVLVQRLDVPGGVHTGRLEEVVHGGERVVEVVGEPGRVGQDDDVDLRVALRRLESLGGLLVVRAGRHDVVRDAGVGGERLDELVLHVLGATGVVGPEGDLVGGLDLGEVDVTALVTAVVVRSAARVRPAGGQGQRGDAQHRHAADRADKWCPHVCAPSVGGRRWFVAPDVTSRRPV